jgi:hypothetical protein
MHSQTLRVSLAVQLNRVAADAFVAREALIKSPLRKSDPVSTIEIHLPLKSKSFLRHPSNLKFGQDFQLRLNQRFPSQRTPANVTSDGKETQPTCMGIGVGGDLSVRMLL